MAAGNPARVISSLQDWVSKKNREMAEHPDRYTERHGKEYAAAVTYFSVLSLVPVTMVAVNARSRSSWRRSRECASAEGRSTRSRAMADRALNAAIRAGEIATVFYPAVKRKPGDSG